MAIQQIEFEKKGIRMPLQELKNLVYLWGEAFKILNNNDPDYVFDLKKFDSEYNINFRLIKDEKGAYHIDPTIGVHIDNQKTTFMTTVLGYVEASKIPEGKEFSITESPIFNFTSIGNIDYIATSGPNGPFPPKSKITLKNNKKLNALPDVELLREAFRLTAKDIAECLEDNSDLFVSFGEKNHPLIIEPNMEFNMSSLLPVSDSSSEESSNINVNPSSPSDDNNSFNSSEKSLDPKDSSDYTSYIYGLGTAFAGLGGLALWRLFRGDDGGNGDGDNGGGNGDGDNGDGDNGNGGGGNGDGDNGNGGGGNGDDQPLRRSARIAEKNNKHTTGSTTGNSENIDSTNLETVNPTVEEETTLSWPDYFYQKMTFQNVCLALLGTVAVAVGYKWYEVIRTVPTGALTVPTDNTGTLVPVPSISALITDNTASRELATRNNDRFPSSTTTYTVSYAAPPKIGLEKFKPQYLAPDRSRVYPQQSSSSSSSSSQQPLALDHNSLIEDLDGLAPANHQPNRQSSSSSNYRVKRQRTFTGAETTLSDDISDDDTTSKHKSNRNRKAVEMEVGYYNSDVDLDDHQMDIGYNSDYSSHKSLKTGCLFDDNTSPIRENTNSFKVAQTAKKAKQAFDRRQSIKPQIAPKNIIDSAVNELIERMQGGEFFDEDPMSRNIDIENFRVTITPLLEGRVQFTKTIASDLQKALKLDATLNKYGYIENRKYVKGFSDIFEDSGTLHNKEKEKIITSLGITLSMIKKLKSKTLTSKAKVYDFLHTSENSYLSYLAIVVVLPLIKAEKVEEAETSLSNEEIITTDLSDAEIAANQEAIEGETSPNIAIYYKQAILLASQELPSWKMLEEEATCISTSNESQEEAVNDSQVDNGICFTMDIAPASLVEKVVLAYEPGTCHFAIDTLNSYLYYSGIQTAINYVFSSGAHPFIALANQIAIPLAQGRLSSEACNIVDQFFVDQASLITRERSNELLIEELSSDNKERELEKTDSPEVLYVNQDLFFAQAATDLSNNTEVCYNISDYSKIGFVGMESTISVLLDASKVSM